MCPEGELKSHVCLTQILSRRVLCLNVVHSTGALVRSTVDTLERYRLCARRTGERALLPL